MERGESRVLESKKHKSVCDFVVREMRAVTSWEQGLKTFAARMTA